MECTMNSTWTAIAVIAAILMAIFYKGRNAVWGGATAGAIIGLIVAIFAEGLWTVVLKGATIGSLVGAIVEVGSALSSRFGKR